MSEARTGQTRTLAEVLGSTAELRPAPCSDCGRKHQVAQLAWDMAQMFNRQLVARNEPVLTGVGRCEECREKQRKANEIADAQWLAMLRTHHARCKEFLRRYEATPSKAGTLAAFLVSLPAEFIAHQPAGRSPVDWLRERVREIDDRRQSRSKRKNTDGWSLADE